MNNEDKELQDFKTKLSTKIIECLEDYNNLTALNKKRAYEWAKELFKIYTLFGTSKFIAYLKNLK